MNIHDGIWRSSLSNTISDMLSCDLGEGLTMQMPVTFTFKQPSVVSELIFPKLGLLDVV